MQTKWQSWLEAWANVLVGYVISLLAQVLIFPLFGIQVSLSDNMIMGLFFTFFSVGRSYALRRCFELWRRT